jgi:hypothetical protein
VCEVQKKAAGLENTLLFIHWSAAASKSTFSLLTTHLSDKSENINVVDAQLSSQHFHIELIKILRRR